MPKKRINNIFGLLWCLTFLLSCENNKEENSELPYIGHHDIALEDTKEHNIGDTIFHKVPKFEYLTQDSFLISSDEISDKIWVSKFFFANCPTICPPMTSAMKEVNDSLQHISDDVLFLAFSIDPEKDTPSRLRDYIDAHKVKAKNWYFLTGVDEDKTHNLGVNGFYIHAAADDAAPGGYAHSSNFVLVDVNQHIRGIYDGLDPDERNRMISDIYQLLEKNE